MLRYRKAWQSTPWLDNHCQQEKFSKWSMPANMDAFYWHTKKCGTTVYKCVWNSCWAHSFSSHYKLFQQPRQWKNMNPCFLWSCNTTVVTVWKISRSWQIIVFINFCLLLGFLLCLCLHFLVCLLPSSSPLSLNYNGLLAAVDPPLDPSRAALIGCLQECFPTGRLWNKQLIWLAVVIRHSCATLTKHLLWVELARPCHCIHPNKWYN